MVGACLLAGVACGGGDNGPRDASAGTGGTAGSGGSAGTGAGGAAGTGTSMAGKGGASGTGAGGAGASGASGTGASGTGGAGAAGATGAGGGLDASAADALDGSTSDRPSSDGPASDGAASDGAASDGPSSDGPSSDGSASDAGPCLVTETLSAADSAAYFPFAAPARWSFRGAGTSNGVPIGPRLARREVVGTIAFGSATAAILRSTNLDVGNAAVDDYLEVAPAGLVYHGKGTPATLADAMAVPYTIVPFPIQVCSTRTLYDLSGISAGADLDGDGVPETQGDRATVTLTFEDVTVLVGTFKKTLRVQIDEDRSTTYSKNGTTYHQTYQTVDWYAAGIGPVKRTTQTGTNPNLGVVTASELLGSFVGGTGHGVISTGWLDQQLAVARDNPYTPNRPAVGSDGTHFMVVLPTSVQTMYGDTGNLQAIVVDRDGNRVSSTPLLDSGSQMEGVAIAWDGTRYLVAYDNASAGRIEVVTVTPDGVLLDGPVVLQAGGAAPSIVVTSAGFLVSYYQLVLKAGTGSTYLRNVWLATVDAHGHATSRVELFPATEQWSAVLAKDDAGGVMAVFNTPPATPSPTSPETADILAASRLTADGHAVDAAPVPVAAMPMVGHAEADLVFDGTSFVASWVEPASTSRPVHIARIAPDGTLLDGPATADGITVGNPTLVKSTPRLARFSSGSLLVWGWTSADFTGGGISGTRVTTDGKLLDVPTDGDGRWFISDFGASSYGLPEILWSGDRALVTWVTQAGQNTVYAAASGVAYPW
jgi:hypothetical protein